MLFIQTRAFSFFEAQPNPRFEVVLTLEHLERAMNFLRQQKVIAFDYETNGTEWWKHARPCGVGLAGWDVDEARPRNFYIPYRHQTGQAQLPPELVIGAQKELLEAPEIRKVAHHLKFDEHMAHRDGIRVIGPRDDTMIAGRLYNEEGTMRLKDRALFDLGDPDAHLHEELLDTEIIRLAKFAGFGKKQYLDAFGYSQIDCWQCGAYAGYDVEATLRLWKFYGEKGIYDYYKRVYPTEMALTEVITEAEEIGLQLDVPYLQALHSALTKEQEKAKGLFFLESGLDYFNLDSDDELRFAIQKKLRFPLTKETKKRQLSVDSDVLEGFVPAAPYFRHLLRYRDCAKKTSTYTTALVENADAYGVLHVDMKQVGTNTGRLSCEKPNGQNIPTDDEKRAKAAYNGTDPESIKRGFIVQRKGPHPFGAKKLYRLFFDYSQIELRVLAAYTKDERMVQAYVAGKDIHDETEEAVFGTKGPNRRYAKVVNFGLCLAEGQKVLTDHGLVPLERVTDRHLVWDGVEWVRHDGLVCRGEQEVITYDGITATPEHEVFTEDGWKVPIRELASSVRKRCLAVGAFGETPIGYAAFDRRHREESPEHEVLRGRMFHLSETSLDSRLEYLLWENDELPVSARQIQGYARTHFGDALRRYGAALRERYACFFEALQGAWNPCAIRFAGAFHSLGTPEMAQYQFSGVGLRSEGQRWPLQSRKFAVDHAERKHSERAKVVKVYDLLNAGPRHRFTVEGKIVSNSYCMGPQGFARQTGVTEELAQSYFDEYGKKFPGVLAFREKFWAFIETNGCKFDNWWGRTRRVNDLRSNNIWEKRRAQRQAIATLIQGTAAELTKESLVRVYRWLRENNMRSRFVLTVHDEIQIDGPIDELATVARKTKELMEDYPEFHPVPIVTSSEVSFTSWAKNHKEHLALEAAA